MLFVVCFISMIVASSAVIPDRKIKWDGLRVTWGPTLSNSNFFVKYPRTETEAVNEGFRKIGDCDLNALWRGKRYVKGDDFFVCLLFDLNGYIAGIQTTISKNFSTTFPSQKIQPPFMDDGDRWVISGYFTEPSKICTTGRTAEEFAEEGTGTDLYIQNSSVPELSTLIPSKMCDLGCSLWTKAKCVPLMGIHHYYDLRKDLDCDELFPVTLLYNSGELTVFAWTLLVNMPSNRFEHSGPPVFPLFMDPIPTCMNNYAVVSTMHVYFTDNVTLNRC